MRSASNPPFSSLKNKAMGIIDALILLIAKHYSFDGRTYPALEGAKSNERFAFALNHSVLHFSKTTGQLASICEAIDHGQEVDLVELRAIVPKAFISVLRLAELVDLSEADLLSAVESKYQDKISTIAFSAEVKRNAA